MDLPGEQIQFLLRVFRDCPYPDEFQRAAIARDLGLHPQQIRYWFMNHRARMGLEEEEEDVYYNYSRSRDVYYSEDVVDYSKDKDKNSKDKDNDSKDKGDEKKKKDDDKSH